MSMTEQPNNDFDFGVCNDELSIKIVTIEANDVALKEGEFLNPFYIGVASPPQLDSMDEKQMYSTYKRVLIMCMKQDYDNNPKAEKIYNMILSTQDMAELSQSFTLLQCSRKILYSQSQYKRAVRVDKKHLQYFNNNSINLETDEIVIPMYELKEDMARLHASLYDVRSSVSDVPSIISLNSYYNNDYQNRTQKQLSQLIMGIKESDFWTNTHNCNTNMTNQFLERSFQWKELMSDKIKNDIMQKIGKDKQSGDEVLKVIGKLAGNGENYQLGQNVHKPDAFVDLSNVLKAQTKRTYYATVDSNNLLITRDTVSQLFESLTNEKEMYDLFNTLLVSKEYCHMVINNPIVLTKMKPLFNKFMPLYKYLFAYAWTAFYTEECLFKTKATKNSRFVFDIRTAQHLPVFPFCTDDVYQNPYLTFLVSEKVADVNNNCMALGMLEDHNSYGIDTLERFRWKFNLFTTGDPTKNIFDGLEWGNKYAISGSIIPAFVPIRSPLFDLVADKSQPEHKQWSAFFAQYYPDSDIDFMCNDESVFDFMDSIDYVKKLVEKNLNKNIANGEVKVQVEPIKTTSIVINGQYITEKLSAIREDLCKPDITVEYILNNLNSKDIKNYFYSIYYDQKRKNTKAQRLNLKNKPLNPLYEDYFDAAHRDDLKIYVTTYEVEKDSTVAKDCETCFYVNDFRDVGNKVSEDKNIMLLKVAENIKFKLKSDKLLHSIEAFRVKSLDPFSVVARFHLSCVRGYYDGETVYMLPSLITAMMTGMNPDYKYFAGVRDPIEILNKYRMRGYGTFLNSVEKQHMAYYNGNVPSWGKMLGVDPKTKDSAKNVFGFKDITHDMFKPGHFFKGQALDSYQKITRKTIKTVDDLKKVYKTKYGYDCDKTGIDLFKFRAVGSEGKLNPLNKWIMNACWDLFK